MGAHDWHQLGQVYRVSGVEGQRPTVVAVTVCQVRSMVRVVGERAVRGRSARRPLIPGALASRGTAAALRREQGLVLG